MWQGLTSFHTNSEAKRKIKTKENANASQNSKTIIHKKCNRSRTKINAKLVIYQDVCLERKKNIEYT